MGRQRTITRRTLLFTTVAVAGGAAFGVWTAREVPPNPLDPGAGAATLNPWLILDAQGATVVVPRAEMGQGVSTTLAALVAEELDVDFATIRVIHGPPAQAYFNGALMEGGLPYPTYALTNRQRWIGEQMAVVLKLLSLQVTGGSTSTVDAFEKMRLAGATARETLKLAAAARLGVDASTLTTEAGQVIAKDGTRLAYTDLATDAAAIDPPEVTLRDPSQWKYLGRTLPRTDMVAKSTGTAAFAIDTRLPGKRFATLRMNPHLGGPMTSFDPAPALAIPGVEKVIDLGHGIAVVARSTWHAFQGADAVEIAWGAAPYPDTPDAMFDTIAMAFDADENSALRDDGTIPAPGAGEITAEYRVPFLAHATMEPMNATALRSPDGLEVWYGNQAPSPRATNAPLRWG